MTITYRLVKGAALTHAELDANFTDLNTKITDLVDSAPGALNTLNELAAALADDANYAATITTALGTKEPAITAGTVTQYYKGDKTWATLDSAAVTENTNLYYTDARADARIAAADTDDIAEGSSNLYYTDVRADARITTAGSANWNTAFGWGDHASGGYLTSAPTEGSFSVQTASFSATAGTRYGVNTTSVAVTATLPASPSAGDAIFFADAGGAYATNNLTIGRNGNTIMGLTSDMTVSTNDQSVGVFYTGSDWRIY